MKTLRPRLVSSLTVFFYRHVLDRLLFFFILMSTNIALSSLFTYWQ
jgi:hypothetical protein